MTGAVGRDAGRQPKCVSNWPPTATPGHRSCSLHSSRARAVLAQIRGNVNKSTDALTPCDPAWDPIQRGSRATNRAFEQELGGCSPREIALCQPPQSIAASDETPRRTAGPMSAFLGA